MSAKIYMDIENAVREKRPDLLVEFKACHGSEAINAFLTENFPLQGEEKWEDKLGIHLPELIKAWQPPDE